jgi:DNA polymerase alpha-associated DNA helicase A
VGIERGLSLLHGPPGTGKTFTLLGVLNCLFVKSVIIEKDRSKKILVCAPSNKAIDEIILKVIKTGVLIEKRR